MDGVNENLKTANTTLNSFMDEIREDIKRIFRRLPPIPVASNSPLRLTNMGRDIAKTPEAGTWAQRTAAVVRDQVAELPDYDVQEFCSEYVRNWQPAPDMDASHQGMCLRIGH